MAVQDAPDRLLALCSSYRRRGRAAQEPETVGVGAKLGQLDPIVGVVPCRIGQTRPPEAGYIDAVVGGAECRMLW